jgi:DNA-directed RNA polymerase subunit L
MEITVLEENKSKLHVEIRDSPVLTMDLLKTELWTNAHVKVVGTNVPHPLIKKQVFVIETDGEDPHKTIKASLKKLEKSLDKAKESLKGLK